MSSRITESDSPYDDLEKQSTRFLLEAMNALDRTVPEAVALAIPAIESLVESIVPKFEQGGRIFYMGSGTSGRLGIVDASECPPTFGVSEGRVVGIIAGGDAAIRKAQEGAEDSTEAGWRDLQAFAPTALDTLVGLSASGSTPYVLGALQSARHAGINTGCIVCNPNSIIASTVHWPVVIVVGPEFITGSTRLKSGTAQKLALNMLTTTVMIRTGRVAGNRMVDMQLTNAKLEDRGTRYVVEATGLNPDAARTWLMLYGNVRAAVEAWEASQE